MNPLRNKFIMRGIALFVLTAFFALPAMAALRFQTAGTKDVRNAMVTAILTEIDEDAGAGLLRIYSGAAPATCAALGAQVLLAELTFSVTSGAVSGGILTFAAITSGTGTAGAGGGTTATWFRVTDAGGECVFDGNVAVSSSDLNLNTTTIVQNAVVSINNFMTITAPNP